MATATIPVPRLPVDGKSTAAVDKAGTKMQEGDAELNSPALDAKGKPTQRAITTAKQAWTIAKRHRDTAISGRIRTAADIAAKYNGDPPWKRKELESQGQGWRNNFSTNFLASIVDRVTPQFTDPVNKADLITHSFLPSSFPDGASKSRKFCEVMSKTIRAWNKWKDLLSGTAKEVVLYGNACPARIDTNWRPRLWGFGECFLPEGTGQHASDVQIAIFWQPLLLHEFVKLFDDAEAAKRANYNLEGCIQVANRTTGTSTENRDPTPLDQQDVIREGGGLMGWSFQNGTRTVNLFHVLVRDYTGEVDLWTVDAQEGVEVRHELGLHESIEDGTALFTFQSGNRKYYGSKGLGRLEANLHTAIERGRNLGADQMYLSGLLVFAGDPKDAAQLQTKVRHPFVIIKEGLKLVEQQIEFSPEAFEAMDAKLVAIAESIAGAFVPPNLDNGGSSRTKIEAAQKAEREIAVKEGVLGRFWDNLSELVSMMQRAICCADNIREAARIYKLKKDKMEKSATRVIERRVFNILKKAKVPLDKVEAAPEIMVADQEAVNAIIELLEAGLSPEEIVTLSLQPAGSNSNDEGVDKDNRTVQVLGENQQAPSPFINQRKATEMRLKILVGDDRASQLIIPEEDPTIRAIASRTQKIELAEIIDGVDMEVAGTDDHAIHREVLAPLLGGIVQSLEHNPTVALIKASGLGIKHYMAHLQMDKVSPMEQLKQEAGVMQQWQQVVDKATAMLEKRKADIEASGGTMGPDGLPTPVQGQPTQVGPDGNFIGAGSGEQPPGAITPELQVKAAAHLADIEARKQDQAIAAQKLALDQSKHDHQVTRDAIQLQQGNLAILSDSAKAAAQQGQAAAAHELNATVQKAKIEAGATTS